MATDLWVFGDESGTDEREWHTVVGGFIATQKHWESFNAAWREVLDWAEAMEFHATWFFNRNDSKLASLAKNPYKGWSESRAKEFLRRLLLVIVEHPRVQPVASLVDNRSFWSHSWGDRAFLSGGTWNNATKRFKTVGMPNKTYVLPFFFMLGDALDRAEDGAKVHLTMDESKVLRGGVVETYSSYRRGRSTPEQRVKMGELVSGPSHIHEGIQAADMFVHLTYCAFKLDRTSRKFTDERLTAASTIFEKHKYEPPIVRERGLETILVDSLSPQDRELVRVFEPERREKRLWRPPS